MGASLSLSSVIAHDAFQATTVARMLSRANLSLAAFAHCVTCLAGRMEAAGRPDGRTVRRPRHATPQAPLRTLASNEVGLDTVARVERERLIAERATRRCWRLAAYTMSPAQRRVCICGWWRRRQSSRSWRTETVWPDESHYESAHTHTRTHSLTWAREHEHGHEHIRHVLAAPVFVLWLFP